MKWILRVNETQSKWALLAFDSMLALVWPMQPWSGIVLQHSDPVEYHHDSTYIVHMHTFNQSLHLFTVRFYQTNTSRVTVAFVSMNDHENRKIKLIKGYRQLYKVLKWYLWLFEHRVWGVQHSIFALFTRTAFFFFSFVCYLSGRVSLYLSVSFSLEHASQAQNCETLQFVLCWKHRGNV